MNRLYVYGAIVLVFLAGAGYYTVKQRQIGALKYQLHDTGVRLATAIKERDSAVAHFRVDTVRLVMKLTRYDTVRKELDIHDTATVIRYVNAADSTIRVCRDVFSSCKKALDASQAVIQTQQEKINILVKQHPSTVGLIGKLAIAAAVGYGAGQLLQRH